MIFLLLACVVILTMQVLIVRQIGVLSARLGPELPTEKNPSRTSLTALHYADGSLRELKAHPRTPCLIVSTTCHLCAGILSQLASSRISGGISVGILGRPEELPGLKVGLALPPNALFDAEELAQDLKITTVPTFLIVDSDGLVVSRFLAESFEGVVEVLRKHGADLDAPLRPDVRETAGSAPTGSSSSGGNEGRHELGVTKSGPF